MISGIKLVSLIERELRDWVYRLDTEYVKGVVYGLRLARDLVEREHRARPKFDRSAPRWSPHVIRQMTKSSVRLIKAGEPGQARRMLERMMVRGLGIAQDKIFEIK